MRALEHECRKQGLAVVREYAIDVYYDGVIVWQYRADLLVEGKLIVEVKACPILPAHRRQTLTYLRCSLIELALLIAFEENRSSSAWSSETHSSPDSGTATPS